MATVRDAAPSRSSCPRSRSVAAVALAQGRTSRPEAEAAAPRPTRAPTTRTADGAGGERARRRRRRRRGHDAERRGWPRPRAAGCSAASRATAASRPSPLNPAPNEFAQPIDAGTPTVDYDKLIADIASLRARVAAVGDTLFHSRIAIRSAPTAITVASGTSSISLDDGVVYTAPPGFKADDWQDVYAHALAPGRHAITVDVDRKDDRNDAFRNSQRIALHRRGPARSASSPCA